MRKSSKLAFLLALVMGTASVFAACNEPYRPYEEPMTPAQQEEQEMNALYIQRVEKWKQYIEYEAPEISNVSAKLTKLTEKDTAKSKASLEVKKGSYTTITTDNTTEGVTKTKRQIVSTETGTELLSFESVVNAPVETETPGVFDYSKMANDVIYAPVSVHSTMIGLSKTTYKLREAVGEETVDATKQENYVAVVTYSYYDAATGTAFAENLEEPALVEGNFITIADKTYAMDDEGVVKVFDKGMHYDLPTFDKDNAQLEGSNYAPYVYVEQGDYGYRLNEGIPQQQLVGEFTMSLYPSLDIAVYKQGDIVASHTVKDSNIRGFAILPNGNVYICEYVEVMDDAAADIVADEYKYDIVHTILDVTTGAVSTLDHAFEAQRVYTNLTKEIKTSFNASTVNGMENIHLKDGYVLAEIFKYKDGALEGNSTYAVLDANTLEVVEELPKIVPAQFGYAGYVSEDEVLFAVRTADNSVLRYTANATTGDLNLYAKDASKVQQLEEGLVLYNKVVYDKEWHTKSSFDTKYYDDLVVLPNGKLLIKYISSPTSLSTSSYTWKLGSANVHRYNDYGYSEPTVEVSFNTQDLVSGSNQYGASSYVIGENYFAIKVSTSGTSYWTYYDLEGKKLFDTRVDSMMDQTVYEATDPNSYVVYHVTQTYSKVTEEDGKLYVRLAETWTVAYSNGYGDGKQPTERKEGTYYQYFVLK